MLDHWQIMIMDQFLRARLPNNVSLQKILHTPNPHERPQECFWKSRKVARTSTKNTSCGCVLANGLQRLQYLHIFVGLLLISLFKKKVSPHVYRLLQWITNFPVKKKENTMSSPVFFCPGAWKKRTWSACTSKPRRAHRMRDGSENWGDLDFPKSPFGESRGDISYFLGVPQANGR